jgi:phosphoribosylformylglycinamidine synthase
MLVIPGGFSYGDDLGAGTLFSVALGSFLGDSLARFVALQRPVLGICNGFQVLVKAGLLPGPDGDEPDVDLVARSVSLTRNDSARFECRWVHLAVNTASPCVFTRDLDELIYCPVAHGEGKFVTRDPTVLERVDVQHQAALHYVAADGGEAEYPDNPNGSQHNIAGLCNRSGTVFGLMPHPEDHVLALQHPRHTRGEHRHSGLPLFERGVAYAAQL